MHFLEYLSYFNLRRCDKIIVFIISHSNDEVILNKRFLNGNGYELILKTKSRSKASDIQCTNIDKIIHIINELSIITITYTQLNHIIDGTIEFYAYSNEYQ